VSASETVELPNHVVGPATVAGGRYQRGPGGFCSGCGTALAAAIYSIHFM
jgi:hypothetical protein